MRNRYCVWHKNRWVEFKTRYLAVKYAEENRLSAETIRGQKVIFSTSDKIFLGQNEAPKPALAEMRKHISFLDLDRSLIQPNAT